MPDIQPVLLFVPLLRFFIESLWSKASFSKRGFKNPFPLSWAAVINKKLNYIKGMEHRNAWNWRLYLQRTQRETAVNHQRRFEPPAQLNRSWRFLSSGLPVVRLRFLIQPTEHEVISTVIKQLDLMFFSVPKESFQWKAEHPGGPGCF